MKKINFGYYLMKNIEIQHNKTYLSQLPEKSRISYQKNEMENIMQWKEGNKSCENRMVWT